jgi:LmbE family N-acetylglucosaminyl deacetylase
MILSPQSSDRILLLAPHPDDETLAVGGLLRRAVQAGARVRVVYVTDGENNPWAQRACERRWAIGPADRLRWGVRRREEALAALAALGVAPECATFLGFPDQRLTDLLLAGEVGLASTIAQELAGFGPTHFVLPSTQDAHPDHNALAVEAAFALDQLSSKLASPRIFSYLVHTPRVRLAPRPTSVALTTEDLAAKRRAIECHPSQLTLHRGLLRFLTPEEQLWPDDAALPDAPHHPILPAAVRAEGLVLDLTGAVEIALGRATLFLVAGRGTEERLTLAVPIPDRPGSITARVLSGATSSPITGRATRTPEHRLRLELSLPAGMSAAARTRVFAKVERTAERRLGFFDRAGWRALLAVIPSSPAHARDSARTEGRDLAARD